MTSGVSLNHSQLYLLRQGLHGTWRLLAAQAKCPCHGLPASAPRAPGLQTGFHVGPSQYTASILFPKPFPQPLSSFLSSV